MTQKILQREQAANMLVVAYIAISIQIGRPMGEMSDTAAIAATLASQNAENLRDRSGSLGLSIRTFCKQPMMVGSAFPATRWLVRHMLARLNWQKIKLLVEFGPGTGVFTQVALDRLPADATLLALDTSRAFIDYLKGSIQDSRLQAVCAPAASVAILIEDRGLPRAHCILSGLPFSTLDLMDAERTIAASRAILGPGGIFCAYQMRRTIEPLLRKHIGGVRSAYEWRNIPPCHLYWTEATNLKLN